MIVIFKLIKLELITKSSKTYVRLLHFSNDLQLSNEHKSKVVIIIGEYIFIYKIYNLLLTKNGRIEW
jgi:hypothetical protein